MDNEAEVRFGKVIKAGDMGITEYFWWLDKIFKRIPLK